MVSLQHLRHQWNYYESSFKQEFSDLLQNEEQLDMTLLCGSNQIKAHKIILSACSPVFRSILGSAPLQQHPLIYPRGMNFYHLFISFMYEGEVNVRTEELDDFITTTEELQVIGLLHDTASSATFTSSSPKLFLHLSKITKS
ncbi:unnamed protein product [Lepeophtheirus salmonis]|uniref:(salmon louse) hypothetical protein n=1 Tax=Lepeophtheirus salmonis TaxID=72036 RepID=A0A7R8CN24_LEPSM|nr:unnamed protein product [Lepeophtheirus salmonis]CAF2868345.1 unnamed protein product [Lepeophtheirus salmonis]